MKNFGVGLYPTLEKAGEWGSQKEEENDQRGQASGLGGEQSTTRWG